MVRRSIPDRFDEDMWYAEDYDLWLRILAKYGHLTRLELPLAHLYKADYGEAGLSSRMYPMFRGELDAVAKLRHTSEISRLTVGLTWVWMTLKFILRTTKTAIRRHR